MQCHDAQPLRAVLDTNLDEKPVGGGLGHAVCGAGKALLLLAGDAANGACHQDEPGRGGGLLQQRPGGLEKPQGPHSVDGEIENEIFWAGREDGLVAGGGAGVGDNHIDVGDARGEGDSVGLRVEREHVNGAAG